MKIYSTVHYKQCVIAYCMSNPFLRRVQHFQLDLTSFSVLLCLNQQLRVYDINSHITSCFPLTLKWFSFEFNARAFIQIFTKAKVPPHNCLY